MDFAEGMIFVQMLSFIKLNYSRQWKFGALVLRMFELQNNMLFTFAYPLTCEA